MTEVSEEQWERTRAIAKQRYLQRLQDERAWGGNPVPRAQVMPSYRAMSAHPHLPAPSPEVESAVYLNAEASSPLPTAGLVFDLRLRKRGKAERILERLD